MTAIDIHAHVFPDDLAPRAIAELEADCPWKATADGTVAALLQSMDAAGISIAAACMIATRPGQADSIFQFCKDIRSERIEPFPSLHPDTPDAADWIERFAGAAFVGIKLHPMYQAVAADDARFDPIYAAAQDWGLVVTLHAGHDVAFPDDDDRASPERLRRVHDRFPRLKLLCTHLGGWRSWEEVERCLIGRPVYLGTSFVFGYLDDDRTVDIIRRHGIDRVLFGTDWPWRSQSDDLAALRRLSLAPDEREAVLWRNAARLLRRDVVALPTTRGTEK